VRPLHNAAYAGATNVVRLLIDRGAEIDPRDSDHGDTPLFWAFWGRRPQCVDVLAPYSRDTFALTCAGKLDRLREVVAAEPRLARARDEYDTILFYLPDDERVAVEIVKLLLANGADPTVKRPDGTTAADVAHARGLNEAAELLL
jgi:ankyrin repeat protein